MSEAAAGAASTTPAEPAAAEASATLLGQAANPTPADADAATADAPKDGAVGEAAGAPKDETKRNDEQASERKAPEAYEFKAPEGVSLDADVLKEFEGVARELNMPQAEAQAVVERLAPKITQRFQAQQAEAVARISAQWATDAKADKEIGGDALQQTLADGARALDQFGSPELKALLEDSRLGNHPEVIRFFAKVGKAVSEDSKFLGGKAPAAARQSLAQRMYPEMNP